MAVVGNRNWAIILCKFKGEPAEPVTPDLCVEYFLTPGAGGLYDYWRDISYGKISLDGSKVLGPFQLSYTKVQAGVSAVAQTNPSSPDPLIKRRTWRDSYIQDALDDVYGKVDLSAFQGVMIIFNSPLDAGALWFGATLRFPDGTSRVVPATDFDSDSFVPGMMGHLLEHESGHMLAQPGEVHGLVHARLLDSKDDYSDGWSIMGGHLTDGSTSC
jgi:hypothetical protein